MTTEQQHETVDMMLNMGPQHPATHGVFRMVLTIDGERIVDVTPHIGYLHRGSEKLCEGESYGQVVTLFDRLDYIANLNNELAFCRAVERLTSFNRILRGISSGVYLETSFRRMSDEVKHLLPHDRASIAFASPGREVAVVYATADQGNGLGVGTVIPLAGSNVGNVINACAAFYKTDIEKEEDFAEKNRLLAMGIRSTIAVPVLQGDICSASLNFGSFQVGKYGDADINLAQEISHQVGDAIVSARYIQDILNLRSGERLIEQADMDQSTRLTSRELQVLRLVGSGARDREIAEELSLSTRTVRYHTQNIYQKLGVRTRTQAMRAALQRGLIGI